MTSLAEGSIFQMIVFAIFFGIALSLRASESEPKFLPILADLNRII